MLPNKKIEFYFQAEILTWSQKRFDIAIWVTVILVSANKPTKIPVDQLGYKYITIKKLKSIINRI